MTQPHDVATPPKGGWTLQGYFDEAVRYLATMGAPCQEYCADGSVGCTYRDATGSACVVGHFIPNDHVVAIHHQDYDRSSVTDLADRFPELVGVAWPSGGGAARRRTPGDSRHTHRLDGRFRLPLSLAQHRQRLPPRPLRHRHSDLGGGGRVSVICQGRRLRPRKADP